MLGVERVVVLGRDDAPDMGLTGEWKGGWKKHPPPPTSDVLDKLTHELVTLSQGSQHAKRDSEFCQVLH